MNDAIIIGGGLAGLAAATYMARAGRSVVLVERARELGGRARTTRDRAGFAVNFGPHALYAGSAGVRVLRELGVAFRGSLPSSTGLLGIANGALHTLPGGLLSLLSTDLLGFGGKVEAARVLAGLARIDTAPLMSMPLRAWLESAVQRHEVRDVLAALVRVSSYSNAPDIDSAGAALDQMRRAISANVYYLDDGWQTLVDGLATAARDAGARVFCGAGARSIVRDGHGRACGVALPDGDVIEARSVIVATGPSTLRALLGEANGSSDADDSTVVRAACLDLAMSSLPHPKRRFALGIDAPTYFSVHSATARLAPDGAAVVHVAKYLDPAEPTDPKRDERELEAVMDLVQPGWRNVIVSRRHLPSITVANARVTAAAGGRRRSPAIREVPGLFVAGDWVDGEGMLADAALSSARDAATQAIARLGARGAVETLGTLDAS